MTGQRRRRSFKGLGEIQRRNRSRTGSCGNEPFGARPDGSFFLINLISDFSAQLVYALMREAILYSLVFALICRKVISLRLPVHFWHLFSPHQSGRPGVVCNVATRRCAEKRREIQEGVVKTLLPIGRRPVHTQRVRFIKQKKSNPRVLSIAALESIRSAASFPSSLPDQACRSITKQPSP